MCIGTSWADWLGVTIALCAFAVAFATWRIQAEPEIVVYAIPDLTRPSFVNLVIENMGRGIARGVHFVTSQRMPHQAFGFEEAQVAPPMTDGPLIHGIPFMHAGERRIITWGQYHGLKKSLAGPVEIAATYRYKPFYWPAGKVRKNTSIIDIESFKLSDVSDRNWDKRAAMALERIANQFDLFVEVPGAVRVREVREDGSSSNKL